MWGKFKQVAYLSTKREKLVDTPAARCNAFRLLGLRFHAHAFAPASTVDERAAESLDMSYGAGAHGLPSGFLTEVSWEMENKTLRLLHAADKILRRTGVWAGEMR